jgi:hypothetical protein
MPGSMARTRRRLPMDPTVSADLDKLAAEADRLSGIYVKVVMLAKAPQVDFDASR